MIVLFKPKDTIMTVQHQQKGVSHTLKIRSLMLKTVVSLSLITSFVLAGVPFSPNVEHTSIRGNRAPVDHAQRVSTAIKQHFELETSSGGAVIYANQRLEIEKGTPYTKNGLTLVPLTLVNSSDRSITLEETALQSMVDATIYAIAINYPTDFREIKPHSSVRALIVTKGE